MEEKIFSISEYIDLVNQGLRRFPAKIIGEVSKVDMGPTGNVYFYLKDEKGQSVLKCLIYKDKYDIYGIKLEEGLKIIAEGYPNLHKIYSFAFIAEVIEYSGEGVLRKEYEKLKKKLTEEGLFAEERKRKIPLYPHKIGVITSLRGGAVIADFSNNLGKFGFKVKMVDSRVDGQSAIADLLAAIKMLRKEDIEVLVIMRGGGSLETLMPLMPFNNELLIREVVNFPVPVIAAIGHHKDVPLVSLAADLEVSTPSIAATTLSESWKRALLFLERQERNIIGSYETILYDADSLVKKSLDIVKDYKNLVYEKYNIVKNQTIISIQNFRNLLLNKKIEFSNFYKRCIDGFNYLLLINKQSLYQSEKIILINNPERQLDLGYSIITIGNKIVREVKDVVIGEDLNIRIKDGNILSEVKNINKINK